MRRTSIVWVVLIALSLGASPSPAAESASIPIRFTLDGLSTISFDDREFFAIPAGSLALRAYPSGVPNTLALRLDPAGFRVKTMSISGATLSAELLRPATGSARRVEGGSLAVELEAVFHLTVTAPDGKRSTADLPLRFTTEAMEAFNADGNKKFDVGGLRADPTSRALQLVAKTTAGKDDLPVPGAAVYIVLSGTLDQIPTF